MAAFPALKPAARRYSMGIFPVTEQRGFGGGSIRFRHGNIAYSHNLEMSFVALTQADAKLLRDHYREQQGGYRSFQLSANAWAGHADFNDLVPNTTYWRYSGALQEKHLSDGRINIDVALISVPAFIIGNANGLVKTITAFINSGAASGS